MVCFAFQTAEGQRMLDPLAVARVGRGFEPGVGPDEVRAAVAINVADAYTPGHALLRNDVLGKGPPTVRSFDNFVPNGLGHGRHHRLGLAVADDVMEVGGLIVAIGFDEDLGPLAADGPGVAEPNGMLIEPIDTDEVRLSRTGDLDGQIGKIPAIALTLVIH